MKKILVTFSGSRYTTTTRRIVEDGPKFGADQVAVYDDVWLRGQTQYMEDTAWLWTHPRHRGCGWFAFKAWTILDALRRCAPGDVVYYTDGDCFPIATLEPFFEITARQGIMLHRANGWTQGQWTKKECLTAMGLDTPEHRAAPAGLARFMGFTGDFIPFLKEWYAWCLVPACQTFDLDPAVIQHGEFKEHRTEQAILGSLAFREGIYMHREACEFGDNPDDPDSKLDRDKFGRTFTQIWGADPDVPGGSVFRNI